MTLQVYRVLWQLCEGPFSITHDPTHKQKGVLLLDPAWPLDIEESKRVSDTSLGVPLSAPAA